MHQDKTISVLKMFSIAVLTMAFFSCRKYVEDVPVQGQRVLVYTNDYRLLMNNINDSGIGCGLPAILGSDDISFNDPAVQQDVAFDPTRVAAYTWRKPFYTDKTDDFDWNTMYKALYTFNTVIAGVLESKGGTPDERNAIYAEGLIQRAFTYFTLVNSYSKQYDQATADQDPGVPLLLEAKLFVNLKRATVAEVYTQILKDLEIAILLIPINQVNSVKPNRAAAYALLAKVYLNMRRYESALDAAEKSTALFGELTDYNQFITVAFPNLLQNKEVLLRKVPRISYGALQLSNDLLTLLGTKDLRYTLFTRPGNATNFYPNFSGRGFFAGAGVDPASVGLTTSDTWLIRAECLARLGQTDAAVKILNDLRKFRFKPADLISLAAANSQQALQLVIDERRREFFGTGFRWFDQKRLNKDALFAKPFIREFAGQTYTLLPNSNGYVFPFSSIIVNQNPEIIQNPE